MGTLNTAFWAWNYFKRVISGFRVCFFNNCIEKNQNKTHFEEGSSSHTSLRDGLWYKNRWISGKVQNGSWPPPAPQNGPYLWKSCALCMHFILSGIHTSLHICNHIHYKKLQYHFPKMRGVAQRPFGIFPKIHPIWYSHPSLVITRYFFTSRNDVKTPSINQKFRSTLSFSVTCWPILWKMFLTPCILVFKN